MTVATDSLVHHAMGLNQVRPNWTAMLTVARELVTLEESVGDPPHRTTPVRVRQMLRLIEDDVAELAVPHSLDSVRGDQLWPAVRRLGTESLGAWSIGTWP